MAFTLAAYHARARPLTFILRYAVLLAFVGVFLVLATVSLDKPGGFLGREAVLAQKAAGPLRKRLLQVLVRDPEPLMYHAEIVKRDGRAAGYVRAASYGHTLGGAVGLAMIEAEMPIDDAWIAQGTWTVEIAGRDYPAVASLRPLYDPKMLRIRA